MHISAQCIHAVHAMCVDTIVVAYRMQHNGGGECVCAMQCISYMHEYRCACAAMYTYMHAYIQTCRYTDTYSFASAVQLVSPYGLEAIQVEVMTNTLQKDYAYFQTCHT